MRFYLDQHELEMDQHTPLSITLCIGSITEIEKGKMGYSKEIRLPATWHNQKILGDAADPHARELFNQQVHHARIEADGSIVIEGSPMMVRCTQGCGGGWYHLCIIAEGKRWVKMASEKMLSWVDLPFCATLNATTVASSWSWKKPIRFLPVQRNSLRLNTEHFEAGVRVLTFEDYHPFIHIKTLLESIFTGAGFAIRSTFMEQPLFRSLYMSGNYREHDPSIVRAKMGFLAKRYRPMSAYANHMGRVYADPLSNLSSLGNLVESADPDEQNSLGVKLSGVYNLNRVFRKVDRRVGFFPTESVVAGFEYGLHYRSQYKILNRKELQCFNRIYLEDGIERRYQVINRHIDRREELSNNWEYCIIIFEHLHQNSYQFRYDRVINPLADLNHLQPSDYSTIIAKSFSSRSSSITLQTEGKVLNPQLWVLADGRYTPYSADWALYDGYVTESGEIDLALSIRSCARKITPSEPRFFDQVYFGGADPGMKLTLLETTSLRPLFTSHPGEGEDVQFADLAAHNVRQIDFIHALKQLFNLYFYTDTLSKIVYIEPRELFYTDHLFDWSDRIDLNHPISIEELGGDMPKSITLCYQPADHTVHQWNQTNREQLGSYTLELDNLFARDQQTNYINPLFSASIVKASNYPDAPDAKILQVARGSGTLKDESPESLNFHPKIVQYGGIRPLPHNQRWGWPEYESRYPLLTFHGERQTLCFEDRTGYKGLHQYYDKSIETVNRGRRITLYLHLKPEDVEAFIRPNDLYQDFRATYKLKINGEELFCRLEKICDYNPSQRSSTKCIFLKNI